MLFSLISCTNTNDKIVKLYQEKDIEYFQLKYSEDSIFIKSVPNSDKTTKGYVWKLCFKNGGYDIMSHGQWLPFMTNNHEIDTVINNAGYLPQRVITKKLNEELYVSSLSIFVVAETLELEVYYDKKYDIKQIRLPKMWDDYLKEMEKPANDIPLIYKFHEKNSVDSKN